MIEITWVTFLAMLIVFYAFGFIMGRVERWREKGEEQDDG
jgi:hypothetical protein